MTKVPFVDLVTQHKELKASLVKAAEEVMESGQFILGPQVTKFEEAFARYCGVGYAVGVDNGTNALLIALKALGIGEEDEVITAPNSFLASASSIALAGARPVFVDVNDEFTLDPQLLERAITPRTKAVVPVHLTGRPARMNKIKEIAGRHGLHVVEDCAQAVGASLNGQKVGSFGAAGCFSFHPLKILNAVGDGGMIVTNDGDYYRQLLKARNHGLRNRDECEFWSGNCRLDTIQAAMLLVKMDYLDRWIQARRAVAAYYREHLRGIVRVPEERPEEFSVYQTFIIQADRRDELQRYLAERGIDTKVHYPRPIHLQPAAKNLGFTKGAFPVTERQTEEILSLPIYPELAEEQKTAVVSAITAFYKGIKVRQ